MRTTQEIENLFKQAVGMKPEDTHRRIELPQVCLEDYRNIPEGVRDSGLNDALWMGKMLKLLEGKKITNVVWENKPDRYSNPDGTLGRYVIYWDYL